MKTYFGYIKDSNEEGAILIFANNTKEAKKLAWPILSDWFLVDYIDLRVERINEPHLMNLKKSDAPHVIAEPPVCEHCGMWGGEPVDDEGRCGYCEA